MREVDLVISNPSGLHARPAKVFVKTAKQFKSDIRLQHGTKKANAKSMISILTLGVQSGGQIRLFVDGPDEQEALAVLQAAIEEGLGDEHPPQSEPDKIKEGGDSPTPSVDGTRSTDVAPSSNGGPKIQPQERSTSSTEPVSDESIVRGIPASAGIAIGPLYQFRRVEIVLSDQPASDPTQEKAELQAAIQTVVTDLKSLYREVKKRIGGEEAAIFEAHQAILEDPDLFETASERIDKGENAGRAWQGAIKSTAAQLAALDDELLSARAADIRDVGYKVLCILAGVGEDESELPSDPVILIAEDLAPSDTASLDTNQVLGFCTAIGGANAHTAILARALGLPATVGAGSSILNLKNGTIAILNGDTGTLTLEPNQEALVAAKDMQQEQQIRRTTELKVAKEPAITQDNHRVEIVANIGSVADAKQVIEFGGEGVGLLRSEFLFLDRTDAPSEAEQFKVYRDIAVALDGHPVIIRTLDVGGDKPLPYVPMPAEENPFLGVRGLRLCLSRPELLRTQLRAILQAAEFGPLRVMFPMVANVAELSAARKLLDEIQAELAGPKIEVGIMIEIPAAAVMADIFAKDVDFFSIGTNDLTQYMLAMDRGHPELSAQADGLHPAVLRMIDKTVQAAHGAGKWVGVCGELGADPQAVPILVGLGVDELSVSIPAIPAVKAQIRSLSLSTAKKLATEALKCASATEVRRTVDSLSLRTFSKKEVVEE
ncbi:MAG: phosphoenolpyruvate--protein phosphotransferase [Chloroflexota bacterium]